MAAGPTPLPPRVSPGHGRADPLPPRARLRRGVRALPRRLKGVFQTQNDVLCFASSGSGGMESAAANLIKPGDEVLVASCGKFGERFVELAETWQAKVVHHDAGWGNKVEPGRPRPAAGREPGRRGRLHDLLGDVDRRPQRHPGADPGRARARRADRRGRDLGARRRPAAAGRVGRRRGRRRLAEGAHVPAGARLRQPERARARARRRAAVARATTSTGTAPSKGQRKDPPDSPFTPAVSLFMALDVALDLIEEEGLDNVFERHRLLGRATREAVKGARARALRPRGRELERRHGDQAARVDRRRQGAEDDARQVRHHDRRRPEPAEGQDRPHRALRLLRRVRHRHDGRAPSR